MQLRLPRGPWRTAAGWAVGVVALVAFAVWSAANSAEYVAPWRIAAAVIVALVATVTAERLSPARNRHDAPPHRVLLEGAMVIAGMASYAFILGRLASVAGVLIGMAIGYTSRAFLGTRRPRDTSDYPLWGDRSAVDAGDDGRRWRTGTP